MPEAKKPAIDLKKISNPQLVEALAALHKENTPQNQGKVLDLVLNHASFLAPVVLAPVPKGQNVPPQLQGKTAIQFQLITTKDGRPFFPAFTDWDELHKFSKLQDQRVVMLRFDNYAQMVLKDNRTAGMVVNPLGMSLTLDRKTLESLAKRKAELARGYAQEQVENGHPGDGGRPGGGARGAAERGERPGGQAGGHPAAVAAGDGAPGRHEALYYRGGPTPACRRRSSRPLPRLPPPLRQAAGGYDPLWHRLCRRRHRGRRALLRPSGIKKGPPKRSSPGGGPLQGAELPDGFLDRLLGR